ncbi:sugar ABC transporter substrate-binding protein [Streptomyces sp. NBC_00582]|uniref:sugar ABC transporter substrate-binding protein n=1 Tax=Streptomyces sp. NBC_00582 TaxID=2975783 RepID=UPI002E805C1C|nr:substrate-binding domain-containing protein [Streptomyces sp. NBC_00582]WUB66732.1 substrate-binding domain-containing protein [Streptomyces sp. NBC_00582]
MRPGRGRTVAAALAAALLALPAAACGSESGTESDAFTVGLLLPSRSVPRWEHADRPLIEAQVKKLCPRCTFEYANAENDATRQQQQMISMITKGAGVLILDAADTRALRSSIQEARRAGVPVVAYDRLAEGPVSGFVGFDALQVGRLQGQGLLDGLEKRHGGRTVVMMNGDPTSPNAAWYRRGALSVIRDHVRVARSYETQDWSTQAAHTNMSAAIAALGPYGIDGVLAANDNIASGVISALKNAGVTRIPPVTGQDADLDAVRRIVKGEQYMTVYKPFRKEAAEAAAMAVALGRGEDARDHAPTTVDSPTTRDVPAVLLTPHAVTAADIGRTLVKDGVYTVDRICTREVRAACARVGLTR